MVGAKGNSPGLSPSEDLPLQETSEWLLVTAFITEKEGEVIGLQESWGE
jgi:hypothetical protein